MSEWISICVYFNLFIYYGTMRIVHQLVSVIFSPRILIFR